ncbi:MAG: hypothetical protein QGF28_04765 [Candidatus Thalassarchaeaceae archaeon]|nr:hypothetical protein [Candidatus Thalassarchaeaceae archaeon]MDP7256915.1 hypothetical protein [Candidatus Thalassarchaeaceae archaeon]MDP7446494.1 hypothetical protein [Candidatus Thalassarchaeaceae archaeon]MDP7649069.1 hypothetical protein [Candidatus Thalassarchaeaceae archaeon]HJM77509.1 hypothetical protein [Candidatus Thalassarchaeaceae archaeon]
MTVCDSNGCDQRGIVVSRLSPEGFLVSSGKMAYSFREAYERFLYCKECHESLMRDVWARVRSTGDKDDDHVAPTAV